MLLILLLIDHGLDPRRALLEHELGELCRDPNRRNLIYRLHRINFLQKPRTILQRNLGLLNLGQILPPLLDKRPLSLLAGKSSYRPPNLLARKCELDQLVEHLLTPLVLTALPEYDLDLGAVKIVGSNHALQEDLLTLAGEEDAGLLTKHHNGLTELVAEQPQVELTSLLLVRLVAFHYAQGNH